MRACGTCTACCEGSLALDVLGQRVGPGNPCKFVGPRGCKIHIKRPPVCQQFNCGWRLSSSFHTPLPFPARPDKCGVVWHPELSQWKGETCIVGAQCGEVDNGLLEPWLDLVLDAGYRPVIVPVDSTPRILLNKTAGKLVDGLAYLKGVMA